MKSSTSLTLLLAIGFSSPAMSMEEGPKITGKTSHISLPPGTNIDDFTRKLFEERSKTFAAELQTQSAHKKNQLPTKSEHR